MRSLNDIPVSDEIRTKHLVPVLAVYADSQSWPKEKQKAVATKLAILTVNRIVAELPTIPEEIRVQCREAKTQNAAAYSADRVKGGGR